MIVRILTFAREMIMSILSSVNAGVAGWAVTMNEIGQNGTSTFEYEGRTIGYAIRPGRCRCIKILVSDSSAVEVRVPRRCSAGAVHAFVARHADWILRTLERQAKKPCVEPQRYVAGANVYYLGHPHRLEVVRSGWKTVTREAEVLRVALYNDTDEARIKTLVKAWFLAQAQEVLAAVLAESLERFGGVIRQARCPLAMRSAAFPDGIRLTVREMRTRWGSCSRDGHVTLGAELMHVPRPLIEYVIVHELCHLVHLDHSRAFYFQVAMCLPDWKERRRALTNRTWLRKQVNA